MFKVLQQLLARRPRAEQPLRAPLGESPPALCEQSYQQNGLVRFWSDYEARIRASEAPEDLTGGRGSAGSGELHKPK